jgi:hypothetical protein
MRIALAVALLALIRCAAAADMAVYVVSDGPAATHSSQALAAAILRKAGVAIEWRREPPPAGDALRIQLAAQTPPGVLPGALAVSYPYAGYSKSVTVFLDRVRLLARGADRESALLAYVFVHEITHVIQRMDHHSEEGVMKARWGREDRAAIFALRLGFAQEDLAALRQGLAAATRRSE